MSLEKSIKEGISNYSKNNNKKKAVGLITDKQHILYTEYNNINEITHSEIINKIATLVYKEDVENKLEECISYFITDNEALIYLPISITNNEFMFFSSLLEKLNDNNIKIQIINDIYTFDNNTGLGFIKLQIRKLIHDKKLYNEKIIGEELPNYIQKDNIINNCGFNNIKTIEQLERLIFLCIRYYNDNYYRKIIEELFPNFDIVIDNIDSIHTNNTSLKLEINNLLQKVTNNQELFEVIIYLLKENNNLQIKDCNKIINNYEQIKDKKYNSNLYKYREIKMKLIANQSRLENIQKKKKKGFNI